MRRSRWLLVLSFVVISSLLAWACGGGGEEKPSGPTAPAATSPAGETPQAQGDGGEFGDLAEKFAKATFKVTYKPVTYQLSREDQAFVGTMILYKKGDKLREDFESETGGQKTSTTVITTPDKSYVCREAPQGGEGGTCWSAPSGAAGGGGDVIGEFVKTLTNPNLVIVSTSSRQIGGENAKCYTIRSSEFEGDAEVCLSNEGVPLFTKSTVQGVETAVEGTDFSHDVSDSDFEPIYPVSE